MDADTITLLPTKEGTIPFHAPRIETPCATFYKVFGDLTCGTPPLVVLHGGPGVGHEYLLSFMELWSRYKLPVIFYDQIGGASSTRLPQKAGDTSFWIEELFIAELQSLLDHFQLQNEPGFHLYGHSWGGMIAAAFASRRPPGLRRLVLASTLASEKLYTSGLLLYRQRLLSHQEQQQLAEAERRQDWQHTIRKEILALFMREFYLRRSGPLPASLILNGKRKIEDDSVYSTMYGPDWLAPITGSISGWTVIPRLPKINVPTLVYNGEYDAVHEMAIVPFFDSIPRVRWITFAGAGHLCHFEAGDLPDKVLRTIGEFLVQPPSI